MPVAPPASAAAAAAAARLAREEAGAKDALGAGKGKQPMQAGAAATALEALSTPQPGAPS